MQPYYHLILVFAKGNISHTFYFSVQHLCECQFDDNVKFKTAINEEDPDKMRLHPIGKDKDGLMYWFQLDQDNNVRVYVEEQDDLDGSSWKCIVRYYGSVGLGGPSGL